ncbi:hypothetical protein Tcan_04830 [Toxocara canis]|uniref:Uncharacterized protein n=1 Tax=Toxocara canis TaxID=6265 RepID=A0A0B2V7S5_TOXCA|nr:hypothetical protein Tcan_04830 [Toxocara canis]
MYVNESVAETEDEDCTSPRSSSCGRVRDLARRFERTPSRCRNSVRKTAALKSGQRTNDTEKCAAPEKPVRLHVGLCRRKGSMKKKSKSHLDIAFADSKGYLSRQNSMRKSRSNNEYLSDYLRSLPYEILRLFHSEFEVVCKADFCVPPVFAVDLCYHRKR